MPYHASKRESGRDIKLTERQATKAVLSSPQLHEFAPAFERLSFRSFYPPVLMFGLVIASRAMKSQRALVNSMTPKMWRKVCRWFNSRCPEPAPLPSRPPTEAQLDGFRAAVCRMPGWSARLTELFITIAVAQAKSLGQFPEDAPRDWAAPCRSSAIVGDGTFMKPYSKVRQETDSVTGQVILTGSRATRGTPRMQSLRTNDTEEHQAYNGINYVFVSTWLDVAEETGLILGIDRAWQNESTVADDLVYRVIQRAGDGVHTLLYDRVMTGWRQEHLLADFGVLTINKSVARDKDNFLGGMTHYSALTMTTGEAIARHQKGQPLPIGTSVYRRSQGVEVVTGRYFYYATLRFPNTGRHHCEHHLWVDDGALVEASLDADGCHWWKTGMATSLASVPELNATGRFDLVTTWNLPCAHGPHQIQTRWQTHVSKPDNQKLPSKERALADLRPIPRLDADRFAVWGGARNLAEAINSWIKNYFQHYGRAMRLDVDQQFLDMIAVAALHNAVMTYFNAPAR